MPQSFVLLCIIRTTIFQSNQSIVITTVITETVYGNTPCMSDRSAPAEVVHGNVQVHTHASYSYCDEADTFRTASYMADMKQPGALASDSASWY